MIDKTPRYVLHLLIRLIVVSANLPAQTESFGIITGTVTDTTNNQPLENAIVFLSNTPLGISSTIDGTFRITDVPVGEYELIVSRVGYERRRISVKVRESDSLYYGIKLRQQPIQAGEVDVIGEPPDRSDLKPKGLLFPKESSDTYCIYGTATSLPIGILYSDSAFYMYSLETAVIDSERYVRLWLFYKNLSQTPYDLNPRKCVKMRMKGRNRSYANIAPAPPMIVYTTVDTEQIIARISETVGRPFRAMAVLRAEFLGEGGAFEEWASAKSGSQRSIRWILNIPPADDRSFSSTLFRVFRNSVGVGVMQRYTVYPNNSVNGYVYFPFPGIHWRATSSGFREAFEYNYQIEIATHDGSKIIDFVPG